MKKITYNLSENKEYAIKNFTYYIILSLIFSISIVVFSQIYSNSVNNNIKIKLKMRNDYLNKVKNINIKLDNLKADIRFIKKKWGKSVNYINNLILKKSNSSAEKMSIIENLIPKGVYVKKFIFNNKKNRAVYLSISAFSFQKLLETYRKFSKFKLVIISEGEHENRFYAQIYLDPNNEKN